MSPNTSEQYLSIPDIQAQVRKCLLDIRRGMALCGVEHEHLDDHELYEIISYAYLQLELSGQPMTRAAWFEAMGVSGYLEVGEMTAVAGGAK